MSKIVGWGHWIVGLLSGVLGLYSLVAFVVALVMFRSLWESVVAHDTVFVVANVNPIAWVFLLVCAWGILKFRAWGHVLAIAICGFAILTQMEALVFTGFGRFRASEISTFTGACLIAAWLLLPSVRAAYWHKERVAWSS